MEFQQRSKAAGAPRQATCPFRVVHYFQLWLGRRMPLMLRNLYNNATVCKIYITKYRLIVSEEQNIMKRTGSCAANLRLGSQGTVWTVYSLSLPKGAAALQKWPYRLVQCR
jgi:hypothetical protein